MAHGGREGFRLETAEGPGFPEDLQAIQSVSNKPRREGLGTFEWHSVSLTLVHLFLKMPRHKHVASKAISHPCSTNRRSLQKFKPMWQNLYQPHPITSPIIQFCHCLTALNIHGKEVKTPSSANSLKGYLTVENGHVYQPENNMAEIWVFEKYHHTFMWHSHSLLVLYTQCISPK